MFFLFILLAATVSAQNISNVDFQRVGDEIVVTYNLDESADVWLYVSLDGGKTYCSAVTTTGDVGRAVLSGKKRILWKVLYDIPEGLVGQIRFKVAADLIVSLDDVKFEMVYVQGGTFMMGATEEQGDDAWDDEKPAHQVTLLDYYIGKFEVTQELWEKVMGTTIEEQRDKAGDSMLYGVGFNYPMYYVNWNEAQEFCQKLSQLTGKKYVLPTEAQWEYAARGGVKSDGYKYSGSNTIDDVAWYWKNSKEKNSISRVGTKQANELGIYDMSGNVYEWCSDWFDDYSSDSQTNPIGPATGSFRVLRGGGWFNVARGCRVSRRGGNYPALRPHYIGFRVVLIP